MDDDRRHVQQPPGVRARVQDVPRGRTLARSKAAAVPASPTSAAVWTTRSAPASVRCHAPGSARSARTVGHGAPGGAVGEVDAGHGVSAVGERAGEGAAEKAARSGDDGAHSRFEVAHDAHAERSAGALAKPTTARRSAPAGTYGISASAQTSGPAGPPRPHASTRTSSAAAPPALRTVTVATRHRRVRCHRRDRRGDVGRVRRGRATRSGRARRARPSTSTRLRPKTAFSTPLRGWSCVILRHDWPSRRRPALAPSIAGNESTTSGPSDAGWRCRVEVPKAASIASRGGERDGVRHDRPAAAAPSPSPRTGPRPRKALT